MSECHERPESIEDEARIDHSVIVELSEVFDRCDSLLIVLEVVVLFNRKGKGRQQRIKVSESVTLQLTSMPTRMFSRTSSMTETEKSG